MNYHDIVHTKFQASAVLYLKLGMYNVMIITQSFSLFTYANSCNS